MAQAIILAAAKTAATSTDVVVAAGASAVIGLFVASGPIPAGFGIALQVKTPGANDTIATLSSGSPRVLVSGPATYVAVRQDISAYGVNVGVYSNT